MEEWDLVLIWVTVGHLSGRVEENYEETQQGKSHLKTGSPITQQEFLRLTMNFGKL